MIALAEKAEIPTDTDNKSNFNRCNSIGTTDNRQAKSLLPFAFYVFPPSLKIKYLKSVIQGLEKKEYQQDRPHDSLDDLIANRLIKRCEEMIVELQPAAMAGKGGM